MNRNTSQCELISADFLKAAAEVVHHAEHVWINESKLRSFANDFNLRVPDFWMSLAPYKVLELPHNERLNFLLTLNAINFSYWGKPKWTISYRDQSFDGTVAAIACIGRAVENGIPFLNAGFRSSVSREVFSEVFDGTPEMPMLEERWVITKEVAEELANSFAGEFANVVEEAGNDAQDLLNLIVSHFPSFEDSSVYRSKRIAFYKRAQLLVSDVHQLLVIESGTGLSRISSITAFADYKLPQTLRELGILQYSELLAEKVDSEIELAKDCGMEIQIRAATMYAVELLKRELESRHVGISTIDIDHHLWIMSQENTGARPYHRTRTEAY